MIDTPENGSVAAVAAEHAPQDEFSPREALLASLFAKARRGEIRRSRPLKPWEPEHLNDTHFRIIRLRAEGMRQTEICRYLNATAGTTLSDSFVSIVCNHPDAQFILDSLHGLAADTVSTMQERIAAYAIEAVESNVEIMRTTRDQKLAARIGFDFLDRAGYNSVTKTKTEVEHKFVADASAVQNLADAMQEVAKLSPLTPADYIDPSRFLRSGAEQLVIESSGAEGSEGSGNALVASESQDDSGHPVASVPPVGASPTSRDIEEQDRVDDSAVRHAKAPGEAAEAMFDKMFSVKKRVA